MVGGRKGEPVQDSEDEPGRGKKKKKEIRTSPLSVRANARRSRTTFDEK